MHQRLSKYLCRFFCGLALVLPALLQAQEREFLLFFSIEPAFNNITNETSFKREDYSVDADIIYSYLNGRFHFLSEFIVSTEETDLERFQIGLMASDQSMIWIGRFHSPARYWNFTYHHGDFLQTSISRPFMDVVEDEGGIFPTHISGVMLEKSINLKSMSELQLSASLGVSSAFKQQMLKPFDLLKPEAGHQPAIDMRLAFLPDQLKENQLGLTLGYADLSVIDSLQTMPELEQVYQLFASVYIDWKIDRWRVISSVANVRNRLNLKAETVRDNLQLSYIQAEFSIDKKWTGFTRLENIAGKNKSVYLSLFPDAIVNRQVAGVRLDLNQSQALSVELSRVQTIQQSFTQFLMQWSMVLP